MKLYPMLIIGVILITLPVYSQTLPTQCGNPVSAKDIASALDDYRKDGIDCNNVQDEISINSCMRIDFMKSQMQLQEAYKDLISIFNEEKPEKSSGQTELTTDSALLEKAQKSWCTYREDACAEDTNFHGSMQSQLEGQCRADRNVKRAKALSKWANCLKNDDCGHPVLFFMLEDETP